MRRASTRADADKSVHRQRRICVIMQKAALEIPITFRFVNLDLERVAFLFQTATSAHHRTLSVEWFGNIQ
jgi:hypothetical protein